MQLENIIKDLALGRLASESRIETVLEFDNIATSAVIAFEHDTIALFAIPVSPPVAALPYPSSLACCRRALHFLFVQASLCQDFLDLL